MEKPRFTESQIVAILKKVHAGLKVDDICRQHGISSATSYNRKAQYGGLDASELKQTKSLKQKTPSSKNVR